MNAVNSLANPYAASLAKAFANTKLGKVESNTRKLDVDNNEVQEVIFDLVDATIENSGDLSKAELKKDFGNMLAGAFQLQQQGINAESTQYQEDIAALKVNGETIKFIGNLAEFHNKVEARFEKAIQGSGNVKTQQEFMSEMVATAQKSIGNLFTATEKNGITFSDISKFDIEDPDHFNSAGPAKISPDDFQNALNRLTGKLDSYQRGKLSQQELGQEFDKLDPVVKAAVVALEQMTENANNHFAGIVADLGDKQSMENFAHNILAPVFKDEKVAELLKTNYEATKNDSPSEKAHRSVEFAGKLRSLAQKQAVLLANGANEEQIAKSLQADLVKFIKENKVSSYELKAFVENSGELGKTMQKGPGTIWEKLAGIKDKIMGPKAMLALTIGTPILSLVFGFLAKIPLIGGVFGTGATMITSFGGYMQHVVESVSKVAVMDESNRQAEKIEEQGANVVSMDSMRGRQAPPAPNYLSGASA